jgi:tripartite-type tricarboxylate transporter receptor subunit TctC
VLEEHLPIQQAIGFAVRQDAPDEVKQTLIDAFDAAMGSDRIKEWADENFYELSGATGEEPSRSSPGSSRSSPGPCTTSGRRP